MRVPAQRKAGVFDNHARGDVGALSLPRVGHLLPAAVRPAARRALVRYRHRGLTPADALLVSYPKSGSTWLRFLLAHLLTGQEADYGTIRTSVPPLGQQKRADTTLPDGGRLVRSHEPLTTLRGPPTLPVIYLLRDAHDVCLSYHNHRRRQGYHGDFAAFVDAFLAGRVDGYGSWARHVDAALALESSPRGPFLRVRYEDLRADPVEVLGSIQRFLRVDRDVARITEALAANTRERMQAKEDEAFLHRVGMDGDPPAPERRRWEELVSADLDQRFSAVCESRLALCRYPTPGSRERQQRRDP